MFTPQEVSEKVFPKASFGGGGHTHAAGFSVPLQADGSPPSNPRLPRPAP